MRDRESAHHAVADHDLGAADRGHNWRLHSGLPPSSSAASRLHCDPRNPITSARCVSPQRDLQSRSTPPPKPAAPTDSIVCPTDSITRPRQRQGCRVCSARQIAIQNSAHTCVSCWLARGHAPGDALVLSRALRSKNPCSIWCKLGIAAKIDRAHLGFDRAIPAASNHRVPPPALP